MRPRRQNNDYARQKGDSVECLVAVVEDTQSAIASIGRRRKLAALIEPGVAIFSRHRDRRADVAVRKRAVSPRGDDKAQNVQQDNAQERERREPARQSLRIPLKHRHISMGSSSGAYVNAEAGFG